MPSSVFALAPAAVAKTSPALIEADERWFARIAMRLEEVVDEVSARLERTRREDARGGEAALERDLAVHRLTARRAMLRRYGVDATLGRIVPADGGEPTYVGRFGLSDADGTPLLVDWRAPAAEPFFAATHARPLGLASRRRYLWAGGRVRDFWDEVFVRDVALGERAALDDQSAFLTSLADARTDRMRDVVATIQADQDEIIRSSAQGALVVDGGPGTGKTVVALHRAAYLLYEDPRLDAGRGGVMFIGPSAAYVDYVSDVLPGLGEDNVRTCTVRDLVPEGAHARVEPDERVRRIKAATTLVDAIPAAVAVFEEPPRASVTASTLWGDVEVEPSDWADAFAAVEPGTPHNDARAQVWDALAEIVAGRVGVDVRAAGRALAQDDAFVRAFTRAWPILEADFVVRSLLSVPALLRRCAPGLSPDEVRLVQRAEDAPWTIDDLPLLDAARRRLGDPEAPARARRRRAALARERAARERVRDELIAGDDGELLLMSMLSGEDAQYSLFERDAEPDERAHALDGPFAHVIVDEAQELTDAQWTMVLARCPSRSLTIVGDRAQARHGFPESWRERLAHVGVTDVRMSSLRINYRTPAEIMAVAEAEIRRAVPDANVPTSVRSIPGAVVFAQPHEREAVLQEWADAHETGIACVVGDPAFSGGPRVRALSPEAAKGLEFDLVVVVEPERFGSGIEGAVDRYVAMTRATGRLVILSVQDHEAERTPPVTTAARGRSR